MGDSVQDHVCTATVSGYIRTGGLPQFRMTGAGICLYPTAVFDTCDWLAAVQYSRNRFLDHELDNLTLPKALLGLPPAVQPYNPAYSMRLQFLLVSSGDGPLPFLFTRFPFLLTFPSRFDCLSPYGSPEISVALQ